MLRRDDAQCVCLLITVLYMFCVGSGKNQPGPASFITDGLWEQRKPSDMLFLFYNSIWIQCPSQLNLELRPQRASDVPWVVILFICRSLISCCSFRREIQRHPTSTQSYVHSEENSLTLNPAWTTIPVHKIEFILFILKGEPVNTEDIFVAVKTCRKFHSERGESPSLRSGTISLQIPRLFVLFLSRNGFVLPLMCVCVRLRLRVCVTLSWWSRSLE